jgi:hypothetical protein
MALAKLNEVANVIPKADVLNFFTKLTEAYQEHQVTKRELAKIEAQRDIVMSQIEKKYEAFYFVCEQIFSERKEAIQKAFDIIDRGLKEDDKELVSIGLHSLSKVVSSSPFASLQQLSGMLESGEVIEI